MDREILVRSVGENARLLERKVIELGDEFSKEGVNIKTALRESLEFGAVETLFLEIGIGVTVGLILKLVDKLLEKDKDTKNVNISIHIKETNLIFKLPEDKKKLLDYYKKND